MISDTDEGNDWGGLPIMMVMIKDTGSGDDYEDGDDKDW